MLRSKVSNAPKNKFAAFSAFEIKEGMCRKITWRWGKTGWGFITELLRLCVLQLPTKGFP